MYITYSEYAEMGGAVYETAFPKLELLAEQKIDRFTQGRISKMKTVPDTVKYCMADLINALDKIDPVKTAISAPLSGFSNDGYSETYAAPVTADTQDAGLYGIIANWLASSKDDNGTPLLYLGVDA